MTGERFGRLVVVETLFGYGKHHRKHCRCVCDCGNEKIIDAGALRSGATRSCGCLESESRYNRKHGKYKPGEDIGGFILVEETDKREKNQSIIWKCKCKVCGSIIEESPCTLIKNGVKSCGCDYVHPLLKDLTGMKFGYLTVESIVKRKKRKDDTYKRVVWNCICKCGNTCVVAGDMLTSGKTTSCGCRMNKSARVDMIKEYLDGKNIDNVTEKRFNDCRDIKPLPFDFYLPNHNTVIEYDGEQHYRSVNSWGGDDALEVRKKHDKIKNDYCNEHGISIIRLPYYMSNEEILHELNKLEPVTSKCPA